MTETDDIMKKDTLQQWIVEQLTQSKDLQRAWRQNARENQRFYAGDQWDADALSVLQSQRRPAVVFNRVARTINGVAGLEVQNRQEVKYLPREIGEAQVSELLTAAADWARDNCDAEDEESEAFQDALICALGFTETRMEYEINPDGEILIERGDPTELFWDASARKKNLEDSRWRARVQKWSRKDVKDRWPDWDGPADGKVTAWLEDDTDTPRDATPPFYDNEQGDRPRRKTVEVVRFEWFEREPFYRVQGPQGEESLSEEQFKEVRELVELQRLPFVKQKRRVYYTAWLVGSDLMEHDKSPIQTGFTMECITGYRDAANQSWFSLVDLMKDPARWANKWLSQIMHILNSNAKGGLLAETDAFESPRKAEEEWADPAAITWTKPGAIAAGKIKEKTMAQMPTGIERLLQFAIESISDVPGVSQELLGVVDRNQPGVLESMRKQAGITMLATYFDSMRRYRKASGRILAEFIRTFIADGRLIRVKADAEQYIPLLRDELTVNYDMVVDQAPTSPNQKTQTFMVLQELMPQMAQAGTPMPPEVFDYLPLPESLISKFKEGMQNGGMSPEMQAQHQQMQQALQQMQAQLQQVAAENQQMKADQTVKMAELDIKREEIAFKHEELRLERDRLMMDVRQAMMMPQETMMTPQ